MPKLNGKIALITGGTTGIGAATAKLFQSEGATVIVTGQNPATAEAARVQSPGIEVAVADQSDTTSTQRLTERLHAKYGRIDILFVNAGVAHFAPIGNVDEDFFDR